MLLCCSCDWFCFLCIQVLVFFCSIKISYYPKKKKNVVHVILKWILILKFCFSDDNLTFVVFLYNQYWQLRGLSGEYGVGSLEGWDFFFFKKVRIYKSLYDYYMYHNYCKQTNENLLSAQSSNICHLICQDVSLLLWQQRCVYTLTSLLINLFFGILSSLQW